MMLAEVFDSGKVAHPHYNTLGETLCSLTDLK